MAQAAAFVDQVAENLALRQGVLATPPHARAVVVAGPHMFGLAGPDDDVQIVVYQLLPISAFLGLKEPPLVSSERRLIESWPIQFRYLDMKAVVASWADSNFFDLEPIFSPYVLYGAEWLECLRGQALRFASRRAYYSILRQASQALRLGQGDSPYAIRQNLAALRAFLAGIHFLGTGQIESDLAFLNDAHLRADYIADAQRWIITQDPARPEWLLALREDIDRMTGMLDVAFHESSLRDSQGLDNELDFFLRTLREHDVFEA